MKHSREDVTRFLQAMDQGLNDPTQLVLLEIPTFVLAYYPHSEMEQTPLDLSERLQSAHSTATAHTRVQIPLHPMAVADFPYLFETRLTPWTIPGARNLKVDIIERHDAVISKILRGEKRELGEIEKLGRGAGLSYDGLVDSFCAIDTSVSELHRKRQQFLELIELLFGATSVMQAEAVLSERLGH